MNKTRLTKIATFNDILTTADDLSAIGPTPFYSLHFYIPQTEKYSFS